MNESKTTKKPQLTKNEWVDRYAFRYMELYDPVEQMDAFDKAEKAYGGLSEEERNFVRPETCCEDDGR